MNEPLFIRFICGLLPAVYLVIRQSDAGSLEVRSLALFLLLRVIVKSLDSNSSEDSDGRNVAYYHETLEHVSCISYETCA